MRKCAKIFIFLIFTLITGSNLIGKETNQPDYLKYVNEIVSDFVKDMEKKHKLHCSGSGGRMPKDVEKIEVLFSSRENTKIEEARKMEIYGIQSLLQRINDHEKIRPYLREYPFKSSRVDVSISFITDTNEHPIDGSVAFVFLARDKIFYRAAEIQIDEPTPLTYMNDKNEIVRELIESDPQINLVPLMNEPYEEALKIVESNSPQKSK
jgi:hypothetical protein